MHTHKPACIYIPIVSRHHFYPHPFHLATLRRSRKRRRERGRFQAFLSVAFSLCSAESHRNTFGYHANVHAGDSDIIFASKDQPRPSGKRVIPERVYERHPRVTKDDGFSANARITFLRGIFTAHESTRLPKKKKGKSSAQNRVNQIVAFNKILLFHPVSRRKT